MSKEKCPYCHFVDINDPDSDPLDTIISSGNDIELFMRPNRTFEAILNCYDGVDGDYSFAYKIPDTLNYCYHCGRRLDGKEGIDWNDLLIKIGFTLSLLLVPISITLAVTVSPNFLCGVMLGIILPVISIVFGLGAYVYSVKVSRDDFGQALKATACVIDGKEKVIFKAPHSKKEAFKRSPHGAVSIHGKSGEYHMIENLTMEEAARKYNIKKDTVRWRYLHGKRGWDLVDHHDSSKVYVFIDGEEMTLKEISEAYNIPITTLYHWRKHKKDRCEFETKVHNYKEEQSIEHEQELQLS